MRSRMIVKTILAVAVVSIICASCALQAMAQIPVIYTDLYLPKIER